MARRTPASLTRLGLGCLLVLVLALVAAFNLGKFPGFRGTTYHADFTDASGLHVGDPVEVAGIRVGRVDGIDIQGAHIVVNFDVHGADLGPDTTASIEVFNLLGEKYLDLVPKGPGELADGGTIPLGRTTAGYDIVGTLSELTNTTERINTPQLSHSLKVLAGTINAASPQVRGSFRGLADLSQTIASRDHQIGALLTHAQHVTQLINARKGDLVALMKEGDQIFTELIRRRSDIHALLVNARTLAAQLQGVVHDNQGQVGAALQQLHIALKFLNARKDELNRTIHNYVPYASILINIIGSGPWFDAYLPNLPDIFTGPATGEFKPGHRKGLK